MLTTVSSHARALAGSAKRFLDVPMPTAALLMLKAPRPGFVKTRLAEGIGAAAACDAYRAMVERQVAEIPMGWGKVVHFAPAEAWEEMAQWLGPCFNVQRSTSNVQRPRGGERLRRVEDEEGSSGDGATFYEAQVDGDLGERMGEAVWSAWRKGYARAVLLGGDCPWITRELLLRAERELDTRDLVVGPATDGGYYLLAMKAGMRGPFTGVEWSTARVLAQTLALAKERGQSVHLLPELEDVDDAAAWERARSLVKL